MRPARGAQSRSGRLTVAASAAAPIDPRLSAVLASSAPTAQVVAIANFDRGATNSATLAGQIHRLGERTLTFKHLDSIGVYGTAVQLTHVAGLRGVRGLYANSRLTYYLHESVPAIGADDAWATGVTGRGIGVAILDSGVDATHPDLALGSKTVQNVKVAFNPQDVFTLDNPPTGALFVENVPNTDTSSGHGTHVAGIAAGNGSSSAGYYTGVARDANVVDLGTGETLLIVWALAGFDYVLDHGRCSRAMVRHTACGRLARATWTPSRRCRPRCASAVRRRASAVPEQPRRARSQALPGVLFLHGEAPRNYSN